MTWIYHTAAESDPDLPQRGHGFSSRAVVGLLVDRVALCQVHFPASRHSFHKCCTFIQATGHILSPPPGCVITIQSSTEASPLTRSWLMRTQMAAKLHTMRYYRILFFRLRKMQAATVLNTQLRNARNQAKLPRSDTVSMRSPWNGTTVLQTHSYFPMP